MSSLPTKAFVHDGKDTVGVAVEDIRKGEELLAHYMDSNQSVQIKALADIPLGHKIALREIKSGEIVIKYGESIGSATSNIVRGDYVHTHNLKTKRW